AMKGALDPVAARAALAAEKARERADAMAGPPMPPPAGPIYVSENVQATAPAPIAKETPAPAPAEPEPIEEPAAPEPVEPIETADGETQGEARQPLFKSLQEFKAAAGVGSRWELSNHNPETGWGGHRIVTVATVRARSVGFLRGDA